MADRYWVGDGTSTDWDNTDNWSTTDGGAGGASVPTNSDDVYFTSTANGNVNINVNAAALNLDFTNYNGTLSGTNRGLSIYGSLTMSPNMTNNFSYRIMFSGTNTSIKSNGIPINRIAVWGSNLTCTLLDDITLTKSDGTGLESAINVGNDSGTSKFDANGKTINFTGNNSVIDNISLTEFYNINKITGSNLILKDNIIVTNNLQLTGDSITNRLLIASDVTGVQRTITSENNINFENIDFRDIKGAGDGSWDLSAISGNSGDCGGNTDITFTTPVTTNWESGTTWSTATWSSRVPLPQDTATFTTAGTVTITQDMPRIGSVDFTGSSNKTWTTSTACSVFGGINLTDLTTLTASIQTYTFEGRGAHYLNSAGKTWNKNIILNAFNGSLTLESNLNILEKSLTITSGTFYAINGVTSYNVNSGLVSISSGTIYMGDGIWENSRDYSVAWNCRTNAVIFCGHSTIKISSVLTADTQFSGGNKTYYNFWNNTTGNYAMTFTENNTFNEIKINAGRQIKLTNSSTQSINKLTALGTSGSHITINNTSSTTKANLVKTGGVVSGCDYIDFTNIAASPANTWYVGANSTSTDSTGLILEDTPIGVYMKYWNGAAWVSKPVKYHNGSSFVEATTMKRYTGSEWVSI